MGWWSSTIMGGDTPYDWYATFEDILKLSERTAPATIAKRLREGMPLLVNAINKNTDGEEDGNRHIALQVLGVMILEHCGPMPDDVRALILKACDKDEWANASQEPDAVYNAEEFPGNRMAPEALKELQTKCVRGVLERKAHMQVFRKQVEDYPTEGSKEPVTVESESLFEKIAQNTAQDNNLTH